MKLELKHISSYLPYQLRIFHSAFMFRNNWNENEIGTMVGITDVVELDVLRETTFDIVMRRDKDFYKLHDSRGHFKPILRPLSDLTKDINYGLSTYAFTDLFEIGDCDGCVFGFEHGNIKTIKSLENISKYNSYHDINYLPNAVVNMMYEYHFDVFGLIEQDLAININTL